MDGEAYVEDKIYTADINGKYKMKWDTTTGLGE
jgi:hypothetical protein